MIAETAVASKVTGAPPVWVVNLKRSPERRAYIHAHLQDLGLEHEIVEGVDGHALTTPELEQLYDPKRARKQIKRELALGEIGCSLSQLRLYQRIVDEQLPEVMIMDDDADIQPAFFDIMARRNQFPPDWELILFYHGGGLISHWGARPLGDSHKIVKFGSVAYGTVCYLITLSGARKLLANGYPVTAPSDHLTGGGVSCGVHLYGIDPPCVLPIEHGPAALTTMPDAHSIRIPEPTLADLGAVRWAVRRLKVQVETLNSRFNPLAIR